jgi:hypothetical protein
MLGMRACVFFKRRVLQEYVLVCMYIYGEHFMVIISKDTVNLVQSGGSNHNLRILVSNNNVRKVWDAIGNML